MRNNLIDVYKTKTEHLEEKSSTLETRNIRLEK